MAKLEEITRALARAKEQPNQEEERRNLVELERKLAEVAQQEEDQRNRAANAEVAEDKEKILEAILEGSKQPAKNEEALIDFSKLDDTKASLTLRLQQQQLNAFSTKFTDYLLGAFKSSKARVAEAIEQDPNARAVAVTAAGSVTEFVNRIERRVEQKTQAAPRYIPNNLSAIEQLVNKFSTLVESHGLSSITTPVASVTSSAVDASSSSIKPVAPTPRPTPATKEQKDCEFYHTINHAVITMESTQEIAYEAVNSLNLNKEASQNFVTSSVRHIYSQSLQPFFGSLQHLEQHENSILDLFRPDTMNVKLNGISQKSALQVLSLFGYSLDDQQPQNVNVKGSGKFGG